MKKPQKRSRPLDITYFTVYKNNWSEPFLKKHCRICKKKFKDGEEICENKEFKPTRYEHADCFEDYYIQIREPDTPKKYGRRIALKEPRNKKQK
jgi:hypothetical protein